VIPSEVNPVPHDLHDEAPALDTVFTGHCEQSYTERIGTAENVPAGQFVHPAPGPVLYCPRLHGVQAVAPIALSVLVPWSHSLHDVEPTWFE
jgi:hypothetical protein